MVAIYYAEPRGIMRINAGGGTPALVVTAAEREQLDAPRLLPDNDTLLFSASRPAVFTQRNRWDSAEVVAQSLKSGTRKMLLPNAADARYVRWTSRLRRRGRPAGGAVRCQDACNEGRPRLRARRRRSGAEPAPAPITTCPTEERWYTSPARARRHAVP